MFDSEKQDITPEFLNDYLGKSNRRQHYQFQPHDKILWKGKVVECKTTMNRGKSIQFWLPNGKTKNSKPSNLKLLHHANHWKIDIIEHQYNKKK